MGELEQTAMRLEMEIDCCIGRREEKRASPVCSDIQSVEHRVSCWVGPACGFEVDSSQQGLRTYPCSLGDGIAGDV